MNARSSRKEGNRHSLLFGGRASDAVGEYVGQDVSDAELDDEEGVSQEEDVECKAGEFVHGGAAAKCATEAVQSEPVEHDTND